MDREPQALLVLNRCLGSDSQSRPLRLRTWDLKYHIALDLPFSHFLKVPHRKPLLYHMLMLCLGLVVCSLAMKVADFVEVKGHHIFFPSYAAS